MKKRYLRKEIEEIYDANHDGCSNCNHGYKGRIAVQEVLEIDNDIRDALNDENLEREDLRKMVYKSNVITLLQDGLEKVLNGITSFEEIYRIIEIDSDINENYNKELTDIKKEQKQLQKQEELSKKTSTEVKKSNEITTKTNSYQEQINKSKEEETASIKKEATQLESIINQPKQEKKNDTILSIPEVPVFPEPENLSSSNHLENKNSISLEIPSGNMIEEKQEFSTSLDSPPTNLNQAPLEIPTGSLEFSKELPPTPKLEPENKEFSNLDSLAPSISTETPKEELEQKESTQISFSNNHGEDPTIQQEKDYSQIEFSNHIEKTKNESSNLEDPIQESSTEQNGFSTTSLESTSTNPEENQLASNSLNSKDFSQEENTNKDSSTTPLESTSTNPEENQLASNSLNSKDFSQEENINKDSTTTPLESTSTNPEENQLASNSLNSKNFTQEENTNKDSSATTQEMNHLEPSINLLSEVPSNYSSNSNLNQDSTLNEDEKIQEHTLEHISINPRMEPQLIEQSAPLTPTVTELE